MNEPQEADRGVFDPRISRLGQNDMVIQVVQSFMFVASE